MIKVFWKKQNQYYSPASEASREVANLTEINNPHTPVYGVKEFVCLSVYLSVTKFYKRLFDLSSNQNQKPIEKKFAGLAARAVFVNLFFF